MARGLALIVLVLVPSGLASAQDAGAADAGAAEAGVADAGVADAGVADAGAADAGARLVARAPRPTVPVATANGEVLVTADDVADAIDARPSAMRGAFADPARVDDAGDELARDHLLADEARVRGLQDASDVRREVDRVLAHALAMRAVAAAPSPAPTAAEIQAFYDAHLAEYTRPEQAHVLGIPVETRAEAETVARAMRNASERSFRSSARRHARGRRLRSSGGDLGWVFLGGVTDPAVVEAALALTQPGDTSAPVQTDERFWVLMLLEKHAPEPIPIESLTRAIASRMLREHERAVVDALAARLGRARHLQVTPASRVVRMVPE